MMPDDSQSAPVSRKDFIEQGMRSLLGALADSLPSFSPQEETPPPQKPLLRPPGALPGSAFTETCQPHCEACRNVCPRHAIFEDSQGLPYIDPHTAPCVMCVDVPCTQICPTEALQPLSTPNAIRMGTAVIELTVCTAYQGSGCTQCYESCPIPEQAIRLNEGLPEILSQECTGCGVCVFDCPTLGAITIHPPALIA